MNAHIISAVNKHFISPLVVCCAAGAFTAGALLIKDDPGPASTAAPNAKVTMHIKNFAFVGLIVAPGSRVAVANDDRVAHTVTGAGAAFDSGKVTGAGSGSFTAPALPGSYRFVCSIHPDMHGTLVVR